MGDKAQLQQFAKANGMLPPGLPPALSFHSTPSQSASSQMMTNNAPDPSAFMGLPSMPPPMMNPSSASYGMTRNIFSFKNFPPPKKKNAFSAHCEHQL